MKTSEPGKARIKAFEGCKRAAYLDGGGVPTIGFGATGRDIKLGDVWTQAECDARFEHDIEWRDAELGRILDGYPTSQNQYDALMSLVYNIGFGDPSHNPPIPGLKTSTVLKRHNLGNYTGAANAFLMWNKDNGRIVPGLVRRRETERKLYLGEA